MRAGLPFSAAAAAAARCVWAPKVMQVALLQAQAGTEMSQSWRMTALQGTVCMA